MKIEDNQKKIKFAEDQGKAYSAALDYMKERYEKDVNVEIEIEMETGREPHGPE